MDDKLAAITVLIIFMGFCIIVLSAVDDLKEVELSRAIEIRNEYRDCLFECDDILWYEKCITICDEIYKPLMEAYDDK